MTNLEFEELKKWKEELEEKEKELDEKVKTIKKQIDLLRLKYSICDKAFIRSNNVTIEEYFLNGFKQDIESLLNQQSKLESDSLAIFEVLENLKAKLNVDS